MSLTRYVDPHRRASHNSVADVYYSASITMDGLVIIMINEGRRNVHRALLLEHSGWFRYALNVEVPGMARVPQIPLVDVEIGICECHPCLFVATRHPILLTRAVDIFVRWMYYATLETHNLPGEDLALVKAVELDNRLLAPDFTRAVKMYLVNKYTGDGDDRPGPSLDAIVYAYQKLPPNDTVHMLFVNAHVFFRYPSPVPGQREIERSLPHEFLLAVARVYAQNKGGWWTSSYLPPDGYL
jgi:hypothetical protein